VGLCHYEFYSLPILQFLNFEATLVNHSAAREGQKRDLFSASCCQHSPNHHEPATQATCSQRWCAARPPSHCLEAVHLLGCLQASNSCCTNPIWGKRFARRGARALPSPLTHSKSVTRDRADEAKGCNLEQQRGAAYSRRNSVVRD
jgi:hypothetical protein